MTRPQATAVIAMIGLAAMAALALPRLRPPAPYHGSFLGDGLPAYDFALDAADRGTVRLSDFRGRAVLIFFGYTSCPDVCPLTMARLDRVAALLGERREDVQVLFVSIDPEVDTPARVRAYVQDFDLGFVGLTGERARIEEIAKNFGVYAGEPAQAANAGHGAHGEAAPAARLIPHTSHVFGIDREGRTRLLWAPEVGAEEIAADVRRLLRF